MPQEYYIRQPDSDEPRGPFTVDKLSSLAEADQVDRDTLYYAEEEEEWVSIRSNEDLLREVFPEKKKLSLKPKAEEDMNLLNAAEEEIEATAIQGNISNRFGSIVRLRDRSSLGDRVVTYTGTLSCTDTAQTFFSNVQCGQTCSGAIPETCTSKKGGPL